MKSVILSKHLLRIAGSYLDIVIDVALLFYLNCIYIIITSKQHLIRSQKSKSTSQLIEQ